MEENNNEIINVNRRAWAEIKKLLTKDTLVDPEDLSNPNTSLIILRTLQEFVKLKKQKEIKVGFTREY